MGSTFENNWKKYIQVNIYDRSLKELDDNGVDLKNLLKEIGCSKVWITEGNIYTSDSDSGMDSSFDDTLPLSSTIANNVKWPRCSTPVHSQHIERKFTLNATHAISKILSDDDEEDSIENVDLDEVEISNILSEIIGKVVDGENKARIVKKLAKFEPRTCRSMVETKKTREPEKRASVPVVRMNTPIESKSTRPPLKRTTSSIKRGRKKALRVVPTKSVHPLSIEDRNELDSRLPVERAVSSEKVYRDLTPFSSDTESREAHDNFQQYLDRVEYYSPQPEQAFVENEYDDNAGYCCSDDDYLEVDETLNIRESVENISNGIAEFQDVEESEQQEEEEANVEEENQPSTSRPPILVKNNKTAPKSMKKVSFAVQNPQSVSKAQYNRMMNQCHNIECKFENCGYHYKWKIKYGKLRLLDHALKHTEKKHLKCRICDVEFATSRQIRHHYARHHKDEKVEGYGMKELFSIPVEDANVKIIWRQCYKDQLDIVGEATCGTKHTRMKRPKRDGDSTTGDESESSGAEDAPPPAADYF